MRLIIEFEEKHPHTAMWLKGVLRDLGISVDDSYRGPRMLDNFTLVAVELSEEQWGLVEKLPGVRNIWDEMQLNTKDPLSGCEEEGDPDD